MDFRIPVTQTILKSVSGIDHFRGSWNGGAGIPGERREKIEAAATVRSTVAACRLAGIRVSPDQVAAVLRNEPVPSVEDREIRGYARALERRFRNSDRLLDTHELRSLHAVVLGNEGESLAPTPWRVTPYEREAFDSDGKARGIVMQTLPPRLLPETLEQLVTWLELEMRERTHHPLLVVGTFALAFLAASPFQRGNERLVSILIVHMLDHAGYGFVRCSSLEEVFDKRRTEFLAAFDLSHTRLWSGEADLEPWLEFFLETLEWHCESFADLIAGERSATRFSPLQQAIVETVRRHGTAEAGLLLRTTGANRNTLKDNLRRLVQHGVLEKMGERRGTRYRLKD